MDYIVVEETNPNKLRVSVKNWLSEGWKCQGGVSITYRMNASMYYAQAMVKVSSDDE